MSLSYNFTLLMLIFLRMSGCVLFNPILGRKSMPGLVKTGLTLLLTLFAYRVTPVSAAPEIHSFLVLFVCGVRELLVGFLVGFIIQLFLSVIIMGGELSDMQVGISMARVYDPQSEISMPLSASLVNAMFLMLFFSTNAHLTLIQVFIRLCSVVPYGDAPLSADVFGGMVSLFAQMLIYAVKLSLPMVAVQFISEIGAGLVMRAVPQIDVFVVEIQLKFLIGFLVMLFLVPPYASFLERMTSLMFDRISSLFTALA